MNDDSKIAAAAFIILCDTLTKKQKRRVKRRYWMTRIFHSRNIYSGSDLLCDLAIENTGQFKNFCRLSSSDFEMILNLIGPKIQKENTNFRLAIPIKERLALVLRFLATGDSYTSLMYTFKISKQSISTIIIEVCKALTEVLKDYIKTPSTAEKWLEISSEFDQQWNFPHCLGAIDGKHVVLQAPVGSGSEYFNYKSFFSIVLFALVDANYNFVFADIGCQGRISDGGVFKNSLLWKKIEDNSLAFPEAAILPGQQKIIPYVILGDDAFALHEHLMKPYAGLHKKGSLERIFNYRLSRARRVVENAFGIASAVFRVLRKPMLLEPNKAALVVLTTLYLHNFLRQSNISRNIYTPRGTLVYEENGELIQGSWRQEQPPSESFLSVRKVPRKSSNGAQEIRSEIAAYFMNNGSVVWQNDYA
ncbi:protein ANTAGONIST OF LIKE HETEROCHROMATIN PROTEIN 1-like [Anoplophora glabripennis]|uniref:protein ANTAGONIST OF LIKE HETEROCHROMATIN PROTEIN 1-like n=1 Tax=Anoplophora glabripennis TaxID=217634 RepID=UPI000C75F734|nr:protein ANTAGONIST OF LIKE HETEROCHROMATIN PROTEIN 1-like [Anoplophora glabripennis]